MFVCFILAKFELVVKLPVKQAPIVKKNNDFELKEHFESSIVSSEENVDKHLDQDSIKEPEMEQHISSPMLETVHDTLKHSVESVETDPFKMHQTVEKVVFIISTPHLNSDKVCHNLNGNNLSILFETQQIMAIESSFEIKNVNIDVSSDNIVITLDKKEDVEWESVKVTTITGTSTHYFPTKKSINTLIENIETLEVESEEKSKVQLEEINKVKSEEVSNAPLVLNNSLLFSIEDDF